NVLYVEGVNQKGINSDRAFFRARVIMFLDTVGQTKTKSITVRMTLDDVKPDNIQQLLKLCESRPGKHTLKFKIKDEETEMDIDLQSQSVKIQADGLFVQELENLGFSFKLN